MTLIAMGTFTTLHQSDNKYVGGKSGDASAFMLMTIYIKIIHTLFS